MNRASRGGRGRRCWWAARPSSSLDQLPFPSWSCWHSSSAPGGLSPWERERHPTELSRDWSDGLRWWCGTKVQIVGVDLRLCVRTTVLWRTYLKRGWWWGNSSSLWWRLWLAFHLAALVRAGMQDMKKKLRDALADWARRLGACCARSRACELSVPFMRYAWWERPSGFSWVDSSGLVRWNEKERKAPG
jgi:hypothetical protein